MHRWNYALLSGEKQDGAGRICCKLTLRAGAVNGFTQETLKNSPKGNTPFILKLFRHWHKSWMPI
jgi:hypothetical protein